MENNHADNRQALADASLDYGQAEQDEDIARSRLEEALRQQLRVQSAYEYAQALLKDSQNKESDARLRADQAQRKLEDDRRQGESTKRWEAEIRRWEVEAKHLKQEEQRWGSKAMRAEEQASRTSKLKEPQEHASLLRVAKRARRMEGDCRTRAVEAVRRTEDAQRRQEDARLEGPSSHLEAEVLLWERQMQSAADDARAREAEVNRYQRDTRLIADEVAALTQLVETHQSNRALGSRSLREKETVAIEETNSPKEPTQLTITGQACAALKSILDNLEHGADQTLRLILETSGELALSIDTANNGDSIVNHEGCAVLLIDSQTVERLSGRTLAASDITPGTIVVV